MRALFMLFSVLVACRALKRDRLDVCRLNATTTRIPVIYPDEIGAA